MYYFSDCIGEFKRSESSNSSGIGQLKTVQNSKSCQWMIIWFVFFSPKSLNVALFLEEMKYLLYYFISNNKWLASVYRFFFLYSCIVLHGVEVPIYPTNFSLWILKLFATFCTNCTAMNRDVHMYFYFHLPGIHLSSFALCIHNLLCFTSVSYRSQSWKLFCDPVHNWASRVAQQ